MRLIITLVAMAFSVNVATLWAGGQGRGNGQAKKPQTTQVTRTKAETPKGGSRAAKQSARTETRTAKNAAKVEARAAKADAKAARKAGTTTTTTTPTAANTTTTATGTTTVATEITPTTPTTTSVKNPKLEARLLAMLPPGSTVQDAMTGFKNWGQFVAAVHVSNNLGLPFADLKTRMTGLTPGTIPGTTVQGPTMSLGQAVQSLKGTTTTSGTPLTPTTIQTEVKKAEDAANTDLRGTRDRS